jgi:mycothiol S-conjugate amidase
MCHLISVAAYEHAADPDWHPELGPVWQTPKLYYSFAFHLAKTKALDEAMTARGLESPYAERLRRWPPDPAMQDRVTTRVPCGDYFEVRDRALIAHATQIDPEGTWFQIPMDLQLEVWPTEDFELARSAVPTHLPEDDLFAGIATSPPA